MPALLVGHRWPAEELELTGSHSTPGLLLAWSMKPQETSYLWLKRQLAVIHLSQISQGREVKNMV